MVDLRTPVTTALIYNRLSSQSVLAAAMYQNTLLQDGTESFAVYDIAQLVPDDAQNFVWIGIDPKTNASAFFAKVSDKKHTILVNEDRTKPSAIQLHPFKTRYEAEEEIDNSDHLFYPETLVMAVVKTLGLNEDEFRGLDFHMSRFYKADADIKYLAFIYSNIYLAQQALNNETVFNVKPWTQSDTESYLKDIRSIKEKLKNSHIHTVARNGEKVCPTVQLAISDFSIHLAVRVTLLAHQYFLNMSSGLSGNIAYTNMRHIVFDKKLPVPLIVN